MQFAICLLRVSSDRQFQEGQGIENQKSRCDYFANQHDISIVQYYYEHYSGRKSDRLVINEMLEFVTSHKGDISTLIIGNIDRFTRAGADIYLQLKKLFSEHGVDVIDASGVIQKPVNTLEHLGVKYEWSERSPSRLAEVLLAENANSEATEILTRCIGGQIKKARKGYQFKSADFGYRNERLVMEDGRKATVMVPEENEAAWVKTIFNLRSEALLSDEQICAKLNAMGFKTREHYRYDPVTRNIIGKGGGKPLSLKTLHRIIARPVYCGLRCGKWTDNKPIKLPYDQALVSMKTFNRANRGKVIIHKIGKAYNIELNKRDQSNQKDTAEFKFRHVVTCPHCDNFFVGSKSRGKSGRYFGYYHCNKKHKYYGINQTEFENTVANYIQKITFKKKYIGLLKEVARDIWMSHQHKEQESKESIKRHIYTLTQKQNTLLKSISGSGSEIVQRRLESDYEEMEEQIKCAKKELGGSNIREREIDAYFHHLKSIMEHPEDFLIKPLTKEKLKKTWGFVFAKHPTYEELKNGTPKLSLTFRLLRGSNVNKRQLAEQLSLQWNTFLKDLEDFIKKEGGAI